MTSEVYIVGACRTPIGSFMGCFSDVSAVTLGAVAIKEALSRAGVDAKAVDEVIMGQVLTGGEGQNPARQSAIKALLAPEVVAYTINMLCGSGLKAVCLGYQAIKNGDSEIVVSGGQECMSRAVHLSYLRKSTKIGQMELRDSILSDGLTDAFLNIHMGMTIENLVEKYQVSRKEQDEFSLQSQMRVKDAVAKGHFKDEIVGVGLPKNGKQITDDEFPRPDASIEALLKLKPVFKPSGGTVTAGNASGMNDGAAALVLTNSHGLSKRNLKAIAKIVGFSQIGNDPIDMGIAPVKAVKKLLEKISWTTDDVDLYEINEAFAAQSILVVKMLGLDMAKVNISGSSIALGHPIGASGARILVTLLYNLQKTNKKRGVASLCVGGGMGIALAVEMCD